jgi:drug/metabolite transporter (DMT)-like permease
VNGLELAMVLASALLHASWSAAIKGARNPLAFNALQALLSAVLGLAALGWSGLPTLPRTIWGLAAGTFLAHALYYYWMSRALERADLTLAYPIIRSTPALLPLIAVPLLGESVSPVGGIGIAIVVLGVWGVYGGAGGGWRGALRPELRFSWLTLIATVAYSLTDKAAMAGLEALPWSVALPRTLTWFCLLSVGSSALFLPLAARRVTRADFVAALRRDSGRALASVAASTVGYGLILQAYQTAPASYVVAVRQTSVLFAVGIAMFFLREQPSRRRVLGATATVLGVAAIALEG